MNYSAVINGLKIVLPLLALGLLATLFLLGRGHNTEFQSPFLLELQERVSGREGMSASVYTGSTDKGDAVRIEAQSLRTDPDDSAQTRATDLNAHIVYTDGTELTILSNDGVYAEGNERLVLTGDVEIDSSDGYSMRTQELITDMASGVAESTVPVDAWGPAGTITAGGMKITRANNEAQDVHLVFTNGVKLVYQREKEAE